MYIILKIILYNYWKYFYFKCNKMILSIVFFQIKNGHTLSLIFYMIL